MNGISLSKASHGYKIEQINLTNLVEHLWQEVKKWEKQGLNARQFIAVVRKCTDIISLEFPFFGVFV